MTVLSKRIKPARPEIVPNQVVFFEGFKAIVLWVDKKTKTAALKYLPPNHTRPNSWRVPVKDLKPSPKRDYDESTAIVMGMW